VLLHTSNSHAAAVDALNGLRPWGKLLLMGISTDEMKIPAFDITNESYQIIGSAHNGNEYLVEALDLVAQGRVKPMIDLYPKERIGDAFEASSTGRARFKSVVTF
jgi:D-arabinose 1-dehydrogenase-like Zn-dependent alcohol dehydrogenase